MIRSRLPCPRACRMSGQLEAASLGYCSFTPVSPVHTRSVSALWAMLGPAQCPGDSGRLPPRHPGSLRWLLTHALSWVTGDADGGAQSTWRAPLSTTCIFWHSQPPCVVWEAQGGTLAKPWAPALAQRWPQASSWLPSAASAREHSKLSQSTDLFLWFWLPQSSWHVAVC